MRNILVVIGNMINEIPETETGFLAEMKSMQSSAMYASPEMERFNWERLAEIVNNNIPPPPAPELWQQSVVDIFTGVRR